MMGIFLLNIDCDAETFIRKIDMLVDDETNSNLVLDFEASSKLNFEIVKIKGNRYSISYSRPIFYRPFKEYPSDYKLDFELESNSPQIAIIHGNIKMKPLIIIFLVLFFCFYFAMIFDFQKDDVFNWAFFLFAPICISIHLYKGYKSLEEKLKILFQNLASNQPIGIKKRTKYDL